MRRLPLALLAAGVLVASVSGCSMLPFANSEDEGSSSKSMKVEVEVASDAGTAAQVRVEVDARNDPQRVDESDLALGYEHTFEVPLDTPFPLSGVTVEATSAEDATWISCTITLDGDVIAEQRVTGAGEIAVCEKKLRLGPQ